MHLADHGAEMALVHGCLGANLLLCARPIHQEHRLLFGCTGADNLAQGLSLLRVALSDLVLGEKFQKPVNLPEGLEKFSTIFTHSFTPFGQRNSPAAWPEASDASHP